MNANQAENLRVLIRHMETAPVERLNMRSVTHECGTPACAYGHARSISALIARGIPESSLADAGTGFFGLLGEKSCKDFRLAWGRLFGYGLRAYDDGHNYNLILDPTPQEWAIEARKVLAEHGYSMDTDTAAADAFINRIRKWAPEIIGKDTIRFDMRDRV